MKIYSLLLLTILFSLLISNVAKKRKKTKTKRRRVSSNDEIKTDKSESIFDIPSPDDVISKYGIVSKSLCQFIILSIFALSCVS